MSLRSIPRPATFRHLCAAVLLATAADAAAEPHWGAETAQDRDARWSFSIGATLDLSGTVDETFRAYYHATGQDAKQSLAESYDLKDFGLDPPYRTFGVHFDRQWKWTALRWNLVFLDVSANARAKRDYFIGLGDKVSYQGRRYDHMKIPKGSDFSVDFSGAMTDLLVSFTPVTFELGDGVDLVPSIDLGIALVGGSFELDAGKARGTAVYQNPPVDFVVGGDSSSFIGVGAPMAGIGAELRVGDPGFVQWITRANVGVFAYDGGTKPFTSSSHREKNLDVTFVSAGLDTSVLLPMDERTCLSLGARLQLLTLNGDITSKEHEDAAIVAARERFDKSVDFRMVQASLYLGVSF